MAEYTYSKFYKDLIAQQQILEKNFKDLFEQDSKKEQMLLWLDEYKKTHEDILEMSDGEIEDVEWEKDDEIDDLSREIKDLESKIDQLEEKAELFHVASLEDEMKIELFQAAMQKYTLVQLEEKLGNKFQLI
jgi:hypothetical protein